MPLTDTAALIAREQRRARWRAALEQAAALGLTEDDVYRLCANLWGRHQAGGELHENQAVWLAGAMEREVANRERA